MSEDEAIALMSKLAQDVCEGTLLLKNFTKAKTIAVALAAVEKEKKQAAQSTDEHKAEYVNLLQREYKHMRNRMNSHMCANTQNQWLFIMSKRNTH